MSIKKWRTTERTSGFQYIDFRGDREAAKREKKVPLPTLDDIIIFNEINRNANIGAPTKLQRGIGIVKKYYPNIIEIELLNRPLPYYKSVCCFQIIELEYGLIQYKKLKKSLYSEFYTYEELNINKLHPEIKKWLYQKGNNDEVYRNVKGLELEETLKTDTKKEVISL